MAPHLHDALAGGARELRTHVLDHAEARRHIIEDLGYVLADLAHRCPTVRAGAGGRVFNAGARQMFWQRPAHRCLRGRLLDRVWGNRDGRDLQLFEPQLQLLDLAIELL